MELPIHTTFYYRDMKVVIYDNDCRQCFDYKIYDVNNIKIREERLNAVKNGGTSEIVAVMKKEKSNNYE